ncbi:MAG: ATP-binding cassette domain-containing protein [Candidatus Thorarchaeota archaeon]|nr:ATP-binding cassette domain-containing protein [Candidatus Thorarchaeota archaeon]
MKMGYITRLTRYPLRHRRLFFGYLALAGIGTAFSVLTPLVIREIIDVVIPSARYQDLLPYALVYILLAGLYALFDIMGRYGAAISAQKAVYDLRSELYRSLMEKDLAFYDQNETGQLLARVTTDVTTMREFLFWGYRVLFIGVATLIGTYLVMWSITPTLTLYMLVMIPAVGGFVVTFARRVRPVFHESREEYGKLSSILAENIVGMKIVKSFAATDRERARVEVANRTFRDVSVRAFRLLALYEPLLPTMFGLATGFLLYAGGYWFSTGDLSYGSFVAFVTLVATLLLPARFLSWGMGMYQRASAAAERTFYILDQEDELRDPDHPVPFSGVRGDVEFRNVSFSHKGADRLVLRDISLKVRAGQVVALIGGTGSGKTSLVNLIPRFYDVDSRPTVEYKGRIYRVDEEARVCIEGKYYPARDGTVEIEGTICEVLMPGQVLVDGVDVRNYRLDDLRRSVGMVHQSPFLFSTSIKENIAFARPDASMKEIQDAARAAMIHDFIEGLPEGYDTVVGERGLTLSGGQKQRVAIARALIANTPILVLDDSTSSVDAKTELVIQKALENLMRGRTTFVISHRLSTIRNADLIIMMERGRIIEQGSHDELMSRRGLYFSIHETLTQMEAATATERQQSSTAEVRGG